MSPLGATRWLDLAVVAVYMAGMVVLGLRFARRQESTEQYFVAARSVPAWAMGLSLMATLISSVTFVAYPGASYAGDWSLLVPGLMVPVALLLVGGLVIPFYRQAVRMSAYEYFEVRFGRPVRTYSALAFALAHFCKMGFVLYLMALTITSITGWNMDLLIGVVGFAMVLYAVVGGIEAVIWTDVVQAFASWIGVLVCLAFLFFMPPGGPTAVFRIAAENGKFSLGSTALDLTRPTVLVALIYGTFWYLQRYVADQTLVQRYLVAKTDRGALRGIALGALLCVPVWALFMLIGTCTWAFFRLTGEVLPAHITKPDQVFPYFVGSHLPQGISGLFLASLMGAAMSMLAGDLNSLASVGVTDLYSLWRPAATDRTRLVVAKSLCAILGAATTVAAMIFGHTQGAALSRWFAVSAIVSGGIGGLFLLAFLVPQANRFGVWMGIVSSFVLTVWGVLTSGEKRTLDLGWGNFPGDPLLIGAVGNVTMVVVGFAMSLLYNVHTGTAAAAPLTLWHWLRTRRETRPDQGGKSTS